MTVTMAHRVFGAAQHPPMVLLHGGSDDGTSWEGVVARLATRWRVYVPDLRGHGATGPADAYSFELMRDDLLEFLDAQGLPSPALVGHSMGGVVAYLAAQQIPVAYLVLEETPPPLPMGFPVPVHPIRGPIITQLNEPDPAWWEGIERVSAPTLVIAGGPASFLPQDQIALMAKRFPRGQLLTIEAGHCVHRDRPEEFAEAVLGCTMLSRHD